jgi:hypothetical protein
MKGPIRWAHLMFVGGLILVMRPEEALAPIWPTVGYQILGLILFLSGFRIMQGAKRARR